MSSQEIWLLIVFAGTPFVLALMWYFTYAYEVWTKNRHKGWIFAPVRCLHHFCCGMIHGHKWKNVEPLGFGRYVYECEICQKRKVM